MLPAAALTCSQRGRGHGPRPAPPRQLSTRAAGPGAQSAAGPPASRALRTEPALPLAPRPPSSPETQNPPAAPTAGAWRQTGAPGSPAAGVLAEKCRSPWRRGARWQPLGLGDAEENSLEGRGRGSRHPTLLTAKPSRPRDASARPPPSPPQPSRAVRRATAGSERASRLAIARGGAAGHSGLWETSASGAKALALPGSATPPCCTWHQTPVPESLLPSPCCQHSQPVMLEHLSSLPTQMVRARPQDSPHASRAASSVDLVSSLNCASRVPISLRPRGAPCSCAVRMLQLPQKTQNFTPCPALGEAPDVGVAWCQSCQARVVTCLLCGGNQFLLCSPSLLGLQGAEAS